MSSSENKSKAQIKKEKFKKYISMNYHIEEYHIFESLVKK